MNAHQRQQLEARLKALPKAEVDLLFRRAKQMRQDEQKKQRAERRRFEDLDAPRPGGARKGADPVREYVLKLLAQDPTLGAEPATEEPGASATGHEHPDRSVASLTGTVVAVTKRRCTVRPSEAFDLSRADRATFEDVACRLPAELAGRQQFDLCVGDRVRYSESDDARRDEPTVESVLPRTTVLARRDPHTQHRRAVVANVDAVVIVVSVVSPPLHPRLIDRYLIAIEDSWVEGQTGRHADDPDPAEPVLAVNKTDLLEPLPDWQREAELARLGPYRELGIPVVECSAATSSGLDNLRSALAGKTVAFVGHSGVGKSSLTNALDQRLGIRTAEVGSAANRGRHTTTSSELHEIEPAGGAEPFWVIDTPGIRFFTLESMTSEELRDSFPEIRALRRSCRFNDCTHTHEPKCAVRAAAAAFDDTRGEDTTINPARYETYLRLLNELETGASHPPTQRIRPNATDPRPGDPDHGQPHR